MAQKPNKDNNKEHEKEGIDLQSPDILLYRVKHDAERGPLTRWRVPEVYWFDEGHNFELTQDWQELWFELFCYGAPSLPPNLAKSRWRSLLDYEKAFSNGTGFNDPDDSRADYINKENLNAPNPETDKDRFCGGATLKGVVDGNDLVFEVMTEKKPEDAEVWPPTLEWLLARPWLYFHATIVYKKRIGMFPNGHQKNLKIFEPTLVPLVARSGYEYRCPMENLAPVSEIADPYCLP